MQPNSEPRREREEKHDREIVLHVATPNGPWKGTFPKTATVAEVIKHIVKDMGLASEGFELVRDGKALKPETNTLGSFGLSGTVKLALVATGSGV